MYNVAFICLFSLAQEFRIVRNVLFVYDIINTATVWVHNQISCLLRWFIVVQFVAYYLYYCQTIVNSSLLHCYSVKFSRSVVLFFILFFNFALLVPFSFVSLYCLCINCVRTIITCSFHCYLCKFYLCTQYILHQACFFYLFALISTISLSFTLCEVT